MPAKSTLRNMVLCLSAVCLVCSAVLGGAYAITAEPIAAAQVAKTNVSIAKVLPPFETDAVEGSVTVDGTEYSYYEVPEVGYAVISASNGFSGPVTVMVGITGDGIIHNTTVLSQSETPGLGAKCQTDEKFINQFKGWNPAEKSLTVKKDGGDVDAITASTITSRAYALAVSNALKVFETLTSNEGGQNNE